MSSKKKHAHAFDFFPERWIAATMAFSDTEELAYFRLILHAWLLDGLPDDPKVLARLAKMRAVPAIVMEKFPIAEDGKRRNPMQERIRKAQINRIEAKRSGAAATNAKRWSKPPDKTPPSDPISDPDSESQKDRLATIQRLDNESPPLTTLQSPHSQPMAGEPPSESQVMAYAASATVPITPPCALRWMTDREASDWARPKGNLMIPVLPNWQADLRGYAQDWNKREDERRNKQRTTQKHDNKSPRDAGNLNGAGRYDS